MDIDVSNKQGSINVSGSKGRGIILSRDLTQTWHQFLSEWLPGSL